MFLRVLAPETPLKETECLTLRFQVTMNLKLPILKLVLISVVMWRYQSSS